MNPEKLTNHQLYVLSQNTQIKGELKQVLTKEIERRNIGEQELIDLQNQYNEKYIDKSKPLTTIQKTCIILFPISPFIHAIFTRRDIYNYNQKRINQHWLYMALGYLFWMIVILITAKIFSFNGR